MNVWRKEKRKPERESHWRLGVGVERVGVGRGGGRGSLPADDKKEVNSVEVMRGGLKAMQLTEYCLQVTLTHALSKIKHASGISGVTKYKYATFFRSTNLLNISDNEQSIFDALFPRLANEQMNVVKRKIIK